MAFLNYHQKNAWYGFKNAFCGKQHIFLCSFRAKIRISRREMIIFENFKRNILMYLIKVNYLF